MRYSPIALAVSLALATLASAGEGQKPAQAINVRSMELVREGDAWAGFGLYDKAIDWYETALVVDPLNRGAYIALARVALSQKLPGKAIGLYAEALKLESNDITALTGQGEAYVQRGAIERAKQNLEKVKMLCKNACPQALSLAASIAKGPPAEILAARAPEADLPKN